MQINQQNKEDERHYTIYCHRNKINNKAYIGQTSCVPYTKRWQGHGKTCGGYHWKYIEEN